MTILAGNTYKSCWRQGYRSLWVRCQFLSFWFWTDFGSSMKLPWSGRQSGHVPRRRYNHRHCFWELVAGKESPWRDRIVSRCIIFSIRSTFWGRFTHVIPLQQSMFMFNLNRHGNDITDPFLNFFEWKKRNSCDWVLLIIKVKLTNRMIYDRNDFGQQTMLPLLCPRLVLYSYRMIVCSSSSSVYSREL